MSKVNVLPIKNPLQWTRQFTLSDEEVSMISDPDFIYPNMIIKSHLGVIIGEPGAGKTTILMHIAGNISTYYDVYYVNADISGIDAKTMQAQAIEKEFTLLLPDMKAGLSMNDVVQNLIQMNEEQADYSRYVFIFDTLKKMTDVINKSKAKELYRILRGLTAKGMTIVLLGHTNKYNDSDGNPIYEGTGDLRSDCDELIYLIPQMNPDGSMVVSTKPDKVRGTFEPITFNISPDRTVSQADEYTDTAVIAEKEKQLRDDETVIQAITESIETGQCKQTEIIQFCKQFDIGRRVVERVLREYSKPPFQKWKTERVFKNNSLKYFLC